jgi:hypothetical protein
MRRWQEEAETEIWRGMQKENGTERLVSKLYNHAILCSIVVHIIDILLLFLLLLQIGGISTQPSMAPIFPACHITAVSIKFISVCCGMCCFGLSVAVVFALAPGPTLR